MRSYVTGSHPGLLRTLVFLFTPLFRLPCLFNDYPTATTHTRLSVHAIVHVECLAVTSEPPAPMSHLPPAPFDRLTQENAQHPFPIIWSQRWPFPQRLGFPNQSAKWTMSQVHLECQNPSTDTLHPFRLNVTMLDLRDSRRLCQHRSASSSNTNRVLSSNLLRIS